MLTSHIMQFIRHVMFQQLPALFRSKSFSGIFHVSCRGVKVSSEVSRSLLFSSLTCPDCHKELSLPLAQMNKRYLSCIHRGIVEKYIDLNDFSSICYCSVIKYPINGLKRDRSRDIGRKVVLSDVKTAFTFTPALSWKVVEAWSKIPYRNSH